MQPSMPVSFSPDGEAYSLGSIVQVQAASAKKKKKKKKKGFSLRKLTSLAKKQAGRWIPNIRPARRKSALDEDMDDLWKVQENVGGLQQAMVAPVVEVSLQQSASTEDSLPVDQDRLCEQLADKHEQALQPQPQPSPVSQHAPPAVLPELGHDARTPEEEAWLASQAVHRASNKEQGVGSTVRYSARGTHNDREHLLLWDDTAAHSAAAPHQRRSLIPRLSSVTPSAVSLALSDAGAGALVLLPVLAGLSAALQTFKTVLLAHAVQLGASSLSTLLQEHETQLLPASGGVQSMLNYLWQHHSHLLQLQGTYVALQLVLCDGLQPMLCAMLVALLGDEQAELLRGWGSAAALMVVAGVMLPAGRWVFAQLVPSVHLLSTLWTVAVALLGLQSAGQLLLPPAGNELVSWLLSLPSLCSILLSSTVLFYLVAVTRSLHVSAELAVPLGLQRFCAALGMRSGSLYDLMPAEFVNGAMVMALTVLLPLAMHAELRRNGRRMRHAARRIDQGSHHVS